MTGGFGPIGPSSPGIDPARWRGTARVLGPTWSHLPTLTIGLLGVQIFWSVEMAYASPYLLSLGLTTSHVALVFLAGPLSGLLVQPLVGALADTSTSRWGRRRPYILGGCLLCVTGMLLLGYTRAVASVFASAGGTAHAALTTALAVLSIFVIDFSINAVQAVDRALLVDTLPPALQPAGNACAALMLGAGSVVGFFVGNLPLRALLPFLRASSELEALAPLVSVLLLAAHGITAVLVRERVLLPAKGPAARLSLAREVREIWTHALTLPRIIRQICVIQFFAWLAWFPVLFYTTMYVTDVYLGGLPAAVSSFASAANATLAGNDTLLSNSTSNVSASAYLPILVRALRAPLVNGTETNTSTEPDLDAPTRLGARAQLFQALLALATNIVLPAFIPDPEMKKARHGRGLRNSRLMGRVQLEGISPGGLSPGNGLGGGIDWEREKRRAWWQRLRAGVRVPDGLRVPLPTLWAAGHAVFAGCMVGSFFTHSVAGATFLIACTGFSWGITQWAPFSLLAEAILTAPAPSASANVPTSIRLQDARTPEEARGLVSHRGDDSDSEDDNETDKPGAESRGNGHENGNGHGIRGVREDGDSEDEDEDGPVMIHNDGGIRDQGRARTLLGNPHAQLSVVDVHTPLSTYAPRFEDGSDGGGDAEGGAGGEEEGGGGLSAKAGVILGIHNIFIVIPQFLVTGLSAGIFAVFDGAPPPPAPGHPGEAQLGRNSVVYVFRIGGIWASVAFVLAWRLARELRRG
ncbi:MFS general substrate transporter [Mycena belliarum]|uniref:MFS general substrate transporter n=1 Tax=Mycena belliarum TaxID=1033014 RepID=A0AAD6XID7_9AGAR|nr:MFS general substrate transporter [Mycena belliae]